MIIGIHQPQYLPWLPYYSKIARSDVFVFLDDVQYQKNGLQNRNQLKNNSGRFWLTVPVSVKLGDKLNNIKIVKNGWQKKHIKSINLNYAKALNHTFFSDYLQKILSYDYVNLVDLNIKIIETVCVEYFNIKTKFVKQSSLNLQGKGSSLILNICKKLGAKKYVSGPGGKNYLDENEFFINDIELEYLENILPGEYPQMHPKIGFINDISALDFILNVDPPDSGEYKIL